MKLEKEQIEEIVEKLNKISNPPRPCSVCGKSLWNVTDRMFEVREFNGGEAVFGGNSTLIPFVTISCQNCGNTIFINAIRMGIVDAKNPQNNTEK
jgi:hypothetical protein